MNGFSITALVKWVDHRLPIITMMNEELNDYPTPRNLNYWWNFGALPADSLVNERGLGRANQALGSVWPGHLLAGSRIEHELLADAYPELAIRDHLRSVGSAAKDSMCDPFAWDLTTGRPYERCGKDLRRR